MSIALNTAGCVAGDLPTHHPATLNELNRGIYRSRAEARTTCNDYSIRIECAETFDGPVRITASVLLADPHLCITTNEDIAHQFVIDTIRHLDQEDEDDE